MDPRTPHTPVYPQNPPGSVPPPPPYYAAPVQYPPVPPGVPPVAGPQGQAGHYVFVPANPAPAAPVQPFANSLQQQQQQQPVQAFPGQVAPQYQFMQAPPGPSQPYPAAASPLQYPTSPGVPVGAGHGVAGPGGLAVAGGAAASQPRRPPPSNIYISKTSTFSSSGFLIRFDTEETSKPADFSAVLFKKKNEKGEKAAFYRGENLGASNDSGGNDVLATVQFHSKGMNISYPGNGTPGINGKQRASASRTDSVIEEGSLSTRFRVVAVDGFRTDAAGAPQSNTILYWKSTHSGVSDWSSGNMKLVQADNNAVVAKYHSLSHHITSRKFARIELLMSGLSPQAVEQIFVTALALAIKPDTDEEEGAEVLEAMAHVLGA